MKISLKFGVNWNWYSLRPVDLKGKCIKIHVNCNKHWKDRKGLSYALIIPKEGGGVGCGGSRSGNPLPQNTKKLK